MKRKRRRILPKADINVTPFIDILLVLLVIFMTISPTARTGLNAAIPQPPPPGPQTQPQENVIILSMDRKGVIKINQDEVEPTRLVERLQDIFKNRSDRTMFVQADNELLFSNVVQLIDVAKGAGVNRLGLMTEQISAKPSTNK
ncbi:MAG: biopolymer transporter ExbD [Acidobacteria bacterium]|nr:MAG: biopolymer transporter ExbD [Acidobacteriota bacterium]